MTKVSRLRLLLFISSLLCFSERPAAETFRWSLSDSPITISEDFLVLPDEETEIGIDPLKADTDGDGWSDKEEVDEGTDPLLASSQPQLDAGMPIWLWAVIAQPKPIEVLVNGE